eukprot:GAHX01002806.1.p1 GENE.GAHX01002806.1~~GAHX01002806.1.p1  ORF type:complete len:332 (-),score=41.40 GAHX01002806.1:28-1023(-)
MLLKTKTFFTLWLFTSHFTCKQSFKCLLRVYGREVFFVNLTFECHRTKLLKTGCLTNVNIDYFYYSLIYKYLTNLSRFVKNPLENLIIKYENVDIFKATNKNKYKRNEKLLKFKNSKLKEVTIGVPLRIDNKLLCTFNRLYTGCRAGEHDVPTTNISFLLPITYKVENFHISEIKLPHEKTELVMCKDTTKEIYENPETQQYSLFGNVSKLSGSKISNTDTDSTKFDRYKELYNYSTIKKDDIKLAVIVFLDRIAFQQMTSNKNINKLKMFSNFDENLLLLFKFNGALFTFTGLSETERSDAYLNSDYNSLSLFKLKKVYGKGENARKVHK